MIVLIASLITLIMVGCGGSERTVEMHDTEAKTWSQCEKFRYENSDTLHRRKILITVRYDGEYVEKVKLEKQFSKQLQQNF